MTKDLNTPTVDALPKIFFSRSKDGTVEPERVTVIDRHGADVTRLFDPIKEIGFSQSVQGGFAKARLRFGSGGSGWTVDCPNGLTNRIKVSNAGAYDLVDGLEINSIIEHYPTGGRPQIEITFDAEWA